MSSITSNSRGVKLVQDGRAFRKHKSFRVYFRRNTFYIFRKNSAYVCRPPLSIRTTASSALHTIQNQFASRWTRIMGYLFINDCDTILLLKVVTHMNLPFRPKRFIFSLCSFMEASFQDGLQTLFGNQMAFFNESV